MSDQTEIKVYPVIIPTKSPLKSYNFYVVKNKEQLFLIDAGIDTVAGWETLNEVLREAGYTLADIEFIVLTHHHADHIGLVNRIRARYPIPVYAHEKALLRLRRDTAFMEKRIGFYSELYRSHGCNLAGEKQVTKLKTALIENKSQAITEKVHILKSGDSIGGLNVVELAGHASDQIGLLDERSGTFFVGDHVIAHLSTNALIDMDENGKMISALLIYENELKKCLDYPITRIYSGHGSVIDDPLELIANKLQRIEKKSERILALIEKQTSTAEIAQKLYKTYYKQIFSLVISEVIGHCDRLVAKGKLEQFCKDSFIYYRQKRLE